MAPLTPIMVPLELECLSADGLCCHAGMNYGPGVLERVCFVSVSGLCVLCALFGLVKRRGFGVGL